MENQREKQKENKMAGKYPLIALIIFLIALAGALLFARPMWMEVDTLSKARDELTETKRGLNDKLVGLQTIQQNLQAGSEVTREKSLAAIPEALEQNKLILDMAEIAEKNDMILNGLNFSVPSAAAPGDVSKVTISTNVTGDEGSLISFLKGLEANGRKIVVDSITVQLGETDLGISRVNFNLNMAAYYQGTI